MIGAVLDFPAFKLGLALMLEQFCLLVPKALTDGIFDRFVGVVLELDEALFGELAPPELDHSA